MDTLTTGEELEIEGSEMNMDLPIEAPPPSKTYSTSSTQTAPLQDFSIFKFMFDDEGVHFYTGLETYQKMMFVFKTLGPAAYHLRYLYHQMNKFSVEDQFFLTLIKLRLNKTNFELSRLFGISESVVSNIFLTWINFMDRQWQEVNTWPSRELVSFNAPSDFKQKFPSTRVIIDGTECPIQKPASPIAQQQTFSTYKNKNTVKVLVGATPDGLVSYVSPVYGGAAGDRQIVERSTLKNICEEGDSIMADKGFTVQDLFCSSSVTINMPTFFARKIVCMVTQF